MSIQLKAISDPAKVEENKLELKPKVLLKEIIPQKKIGGKVLDVTSSKESIKAAKQQTVETIPQEIECQMISDRIYESIEQKSRGKLYYIGEEDEKLFCGPVLQVIPSGAFTAISSGKSIHSPKRPSIGNEFKFERDRQVLLKVGKNMSKDFLIIVAKNGCIIVESSASVCLSMPIFIIESTGNYYYLNRGQRIVKLGAGQHLILYTEDSVILFTTNTEKSGPQKHKNKIKSKIEKSKPKLKFDSEKKIDQKDGKEKDKKDEKKVEKKAEKRGDEVPKESQKSTDKIGSKKEVRPEPKVHKHKNSGFISDDEPEYSDSSPYSTRNAVIINMLLVVTIITAVLIVKYKSKSH